MTEIEEFSAETEVVGDRAIVRVKGELDLHSVEGLNEALRSDLRDGRATVLDLREVSFIDSSGLGAIHREHRNATEAGADFAVCFAGSSSVARIFELSALLGVVNVVEELDEAPGGDLTPA